VCILAMPAKELSPWWRGKRGFQVGTSFRLVGATAVKSGTSASSCSARTGWLLDVNSFPVSLSEDFPFGSGLGWETVSSFDLEARASRAQCAVRS